MVSNQALLDEIKSLNDKLESLQNEMIKSLHDEIKQSTMLTIFLFFASTSFVYYGFFFALMFTIPTLAIIYGTIATITIIVDVGGYIYYKNRKKGERFMIIKHKFIWRAVLTTIRWEGNIIFGGVITFLIAYSILGDIDRDFFIRWSFILVIINLILNLFIEYLYEIWDLR